MIEAVCFVLGLEATGICGLLLDTRYDVAVSSQMVRLKEGLSGHVICCQLVEFLLHT